MRHHVSRLPPTEPGGRMSALERALLTLDTDLRVAAPADMDSVALAGLRNRLAGVSDLLSASYLR
jgi:hypothetical protein